MEEMLDLVNEQGDPIGRAVPRSEAHRLGLRHRTSHVWLVRRKNGVLEVLLQKRSDEKDSFPGCYDISSAGHIPAGQGFVDSALRELKEELGVTAQPQDLILCGQRSFQFSAVFHGKIKKIGEGRFLQLSHKIISSIKLRLPFPPWPAPSAALLGKCSCSARRSPHYANSRQGASSARR